MEKAEAGSVERTVAESQSEMTEVIMPNDTNMMGTLMGGRLTQLIDIAGGIAASRHARSYIVTASMDQIDFIAPVHLGDQLTLKSSVNRAFGSSMEVGVKVWTGQPRTGVIEHVASAYLVVVAIDEFGRLKKVPPIRPENPNEVRRFEDALSRREHRERERARRKAARQVIRDEAAIAAASPAQRASK